MAEMERKFTQEDGYTDESLKPCPFCGIRSVRRYRIREHILKGKETFERSWWRIGCPGCGVTTVRAASAEEADRDWNNRVG